MPRTARTIAGGLIYHVLNRGNLGQPIFKEPDDYRAFEEILAQGIKRFPVELLCYALSSDHWELVLRPGKGPALGQLLGWIGVTHARRHFRRYPELGGGHLYAGRYKSFPVQDDRQFLTVCRFVESGPIRARAVRKAEKWEFSSLAKSAGRRAKGAASDAPALTLAPWPVTRPKDWADRVNDPLPPKELERVELSVKRGRPFGDEKWTASIVKKLKLEHTIRRPGRPRKGEGKKKTKK